MIELPMTLQWHDVIGGIGVVTVVATYLFLQLNYISAKSLMYSLLNALGAGLILVSLRYEFNLSAFLIEASWLVISCIGAMVTLMESKTRREK